MRTIDSLTNNAFIEQREGHARPIEQREFLSVIYFEPIHGFWSSMAEYFHVFKPMNRQKIVMEPRWQTVVSNSNFK